MVAASNAEIALLNSQVNVKFQRNVNKLLTTDGNSECLRSENEKQKKAR